MARRGLNGQLNMFDFFRELEAAGPPDGEVEMVSLMPDFEEEEMEPQSIAKSEEKKSKAQKRNSRKSKKPDVQLGDLQQDNSKETNELPEVPELSERSELSRTPQTARETNFTATFSERPIMQRSYTTPEGTLEIAYLSYNKVRLLEPGKEPVITEFLSSKEAVDYYVEQMQNLQSLYGDEA